MSQAAGDVKIIFAADSTSYSAALDKMRSQLRQFSGEATSAGRAGAAAGHGMVAPWQASSAALRVAEGNMTNNIRAAERFLATIPGVGRALQAAFPVVGAIALLGVFSRMGKEVVDLIEKTNKIPQALSNAFRERQAGGQQAVDELQRENDKLDNQIAKLEGRPQNNLAIALDDARIAADKLEQALLRDNNQIQQMLKENQIGAIQSYLRPKAETAELAGTVNYWNQELANKAREFDDATHLFGAKSPEAQKAQDVLDRRRAEAEAAMQDQIAMRQQTPAGFAARRAAATAGRPVPEDVGADQSANLTIAQGYFSLLKQQDMTEKLNAAQEQKQGVADALIHARELQTAAKERAAQQMQAWREQLESQKAAHAMTLDEEAAYWQKLADSAKRGSTLYNSALMEANKARAQSMKQFQAGIVSDAVHGLEADRSGDSSSDRIHSALEEGWTAAQKRDEETRKQVQESATRAFEAAEQQRKMADRIAEEAVRLREASGQLSHADAARALQTINQESFAGWSAASASFSTQFPNAPVPGAAQAVGDYQLRSMQYDQQEAAATSMGALHEATDRLTQAFLDLPQHLQELLTSTVSGFNSSFASAVMAHSASGQEYRRNIENSLAGQFRSTGTKGLESALQLGEGGLLSKLGFGKAGKPDGSQSSPFYVRSADSAGGVGAGAQAIGPGLLAALGALGPAGSSGASAGNFLSTVMPDITATIPFMASGGPISSNMPAIVGENGPELFVPRSSGHIVPNDALGGGSSGDVHLHIDARGATDPASVGFQIQKAMNQVRKEIAPIALAAHRRYNSSRPGSSRI